MAVVFQWLKGYDTAKLKSDTLAGITTGIMLIPQGMAYALIAGLPPVFGLYAALVPPIIYAVFGTANQLSVGPVATVSILIFAGLSDLRLSEADFIIAASLLALLTGLIQFLFGLFKLGFIVNFLSRPVISGYTSAAAIIIGLSQLHNLTGMNNSGGSGLTDSLSNVFNHLSDISAVSLIFGISGILFILIMKKYLPRFPGAITIVLISIILVFTFSLSNQLNLLRDIPSGFPEITKMQFDYEILAELFPIALLISLVGFLESMSIAKSLQLNSNENNVKANKELIALGLANISGSFFQSFPISGGFARSAVHQQAGAKTPFSLIISSLSIAVTLLFLTPVFYYLPKSILAAIIMSAVIKLINVNEALTLWKISRRDFWMMTATFLATIILGVQEGIITGVLISLGLVIFKSTYPHTAVLGKLPDTPYYRNLNRFSEAIDRKDVLIFRFDAQLYFANINYFSDTLYELIHKKGDDLKVIVINSQAINGLDMSAIYGLQNFIENIKKRNINIYFTEVIGPVRDVMKKSGLYELIGKDHFHMRVQDAIDHYDGKTKESEKYATQSN